MSGARMPNTMPPTWDRMAIVRASLVTGIGLVASVIGGLLGVGREASAVHDDDLSGTNL
jgi:hypothetical protein